MSDSYQAIYEAVRSRIRGCDVGSAISEAARNAFDISPSISFLQDVIAGAALETQRPSVVYRPRLMKDGNAWIACYGDNIQDGCVGCGDTPEKAMAAFDTAWRTN